MKQTKRIFKNPVMWASGLLLGLCYILGAFSDLLHSKTTDFLYFFEAATGIGIVMRVIPLITVLAYGLQFYKEWQNGYYRLKLIRAGKLKYWIGHAARAYLSGCLIMLIAQIVFFGIGTGMRREFGIGSGISGLAVEGTWFFKMIEQNKSYQVLLIKALVQVLSGGLWPVLSIAVSAFLRNPYVPLMFPFALCLMAEILGIILNCVWLSPLVFYYQSYDLLSLADNGMIWILGEIILLLMSFSLLLYYGIERRLRTDG